MRQKIVTCVALRRSGTTLLWRTFRQVGSIHCLDEPFNPALRRIPMEHPKKVWAEFIDKFRRNPDEFRKRFAPISPPCELDSRFSAAHVAYLDWLIEGHEHVFFDTTRCQFKLQSFHQNFSHATVVHLYRSPESFASSHLLPRRSARRIQDRVHTFRDKQNFFDRRSRYNNWGMEEIVESIPSSPWRERFSEMGLSPDKLQTIPAVAKLMAYWWIVYQEIEATGRRLFGRQFVSLPFGSFCQQPAETIDQLFRTVGVSADKIDLTAIHPESPPFQADCEQWREWRRRLGIPLQLLSDTSASC